MIVNIKIGLELVSINDGVVLCQNDELKNEIIKILDIDTSRPPEEGFYPQIFDMFKEAQLINVIEDEDLQY